MKIPCPICTGILLRHLTHSRILWFCPRCRQEMPNFELIKFSAIQEKLIQFGNHLNNNEAACLEKKIRKNVLVIEHQYTVVKLFANVSSKRLEVISFIVSKIDMIMINKFADTEQYIVGTKNYLNQVEYSSFKNNASIKTNFIKDSKIILFYICRMTLVVDNVVLNNTKLQELKAQSVNFELTIDRSYLIQPFSIE